VSLQVCGLSLVELFRIGLRAGAARLLTLLVDSTDAQDESNTENSFEYVSSMMVNVNECILKRMG
jgi:ribosomal protein L13E